MGSNQNPRVPLDIAIVGAGIGGLALAIGLLKQNVPFTLYEAAPCYSTIGAGIGFGPNALRAMALLDPQLLALFETIATGHARPNREHVMLDLMAVAPGFVQEDGDVKTRVIESESYRRAGAHRKDLLDVMTSLIPNDAVRFGKRVRKLEQIEGKVNMEFEDGEEVVVDAVIGCDGVYSTIRSFVLGDRYPQNVEATYSGKYAYRAMVPMKEAKEIMGENAGDGIWFMGRGANYITFSVSKGTLFNIVAFRFDDRPWTHSSWTKEVTKEEMFADLRSIETGVDERLVRLLEWAKPLQWAINHHLDTPIYYNAFICLLGDSAHATTPHQASGAGQCVEDALILSRLLGLVSEKAQLGAAFMVYDEIRRPRAQEIVRTSQEASVISSYRDPGCGSDHGRIAENFNARYKWIWEHDLEGDVRRAVEGFRGLVGGGLPV